jgi:predicted O-linked N-acetylglucosamine transferase (SPINDLY family)
MMRSDPDSLARLAAAHHGSGRLAEAEKIYRQLLDLQPNHPTALHGLGTLAGQRGQWQQAESLLRRVVALEPKNASAHNNLGNTLKAAGRPREAVTAYQEAIRLAPAFTVALSNLGNALAECGQPQAAVDAFHRALSIDPDSAMVHYNLANVLKIIGQFDQAVVSFRRAIQIDKSFPQAWNNLGTLLREMGELNAAIAAHRQALQIKPDHAVAHSNLLLDLIYRPESEPQTVFAEARNWSRRFAEPLKKFIRPHTNNRDLNRRLRVGYLSADFRDHVVSRFLLPLLECHNHHGFEIICFSDVAQPDATTAALRSRADRWENVVGLSDHQVAERIRQEQVDLLIDLAGHTAGNRLLVFAQRPAPVQISYLGYPATTGLDAFDYRLTDIYADPPGATDAWHSEKLLRLPVCNWCFTQPDDSPAIEPAPQRPISFGSFNNPAKVPAVVMDLWAEILSALPDSRLVLKYRGLTEKGVSQRILEHFASKGIQSDRISLLGHEPGMRAHLAAYAQIDIALDTFPYHGTTTTCEALWMGAPVITLAGTAQASRVGVSLLRNIGLDEMIAQSPQEYVKVALQLASDGPRLAELRRGLRERMLGSALMDPKRFALDVEGAYRDAWKQWCGRT